MSHLSAVLVSSEPRFDSLSDASTKLRGSPYRVLPGWNDDVHPKAAPVVFSTPRHPNHACSQVAVDTG
jgi:hypothetical protein